MSPRLVCDLCGVVNRENAERRRAEPCPRSPDSAHVWTIQPAAPRRGRSALLSLAEIHYLMDGVEWNADTLDAIARVLRSAGYVIRELPFGPGLGET